MKNAELNLHKGERQIKSLRKKKLPAELQPVKTYLLENMQFTFELQRARYAYLKTHEVAPLRTITVHECPCRFSDEYLFRSLEMTRDGRKELKLTNNWYNDVLHCHRNHSGAYPIAAWKQFLAAFGIIESRHFKNID